MTPRIFRGLYAQVVLAIVAGACIGYVWPQAGTALKPLGDLFVKLIKMLIGPIVFFTVVSGIASIGDLRKVGRVGLKALLYFEVVTTLALVIGLAVVNLVRPGAGMNVDVGALDAGAITQYADAAQKHSSFMDFVSNVVPSTATDAFARGDILQILFFSVLLGVAVSAMGPSGARLLELVHQAAHAMFGVVAIVMRFAPIGAFGAMAFAIGAFGVGMLGNLALLMLTFYATCLIFVFVVLGVIARLHGFSLWKFLRFIREEIFIVVGTSSSESVLPRMIEKMQRLGCSKSVVSLVIPTGYSFNLDGTSIYLTMAAVFVAQACNVPLGLGDQVFLLTVLLLTSKGAAAVTGGGFVTLAATLSSLSHIPVAGLTLILGIDRFMSEARAITNLIGNGVATVVVSRWEGELDHARLHAALDDALPSAGVVTAGDADLAGAAES